MPLTDEFLRKLDDANIAGRARRDDGMARVDANADDEWKALAWDTLVAYLHTHEFFFVDNFWIETELERPREARALGPIVQRAARAKFITQTGVCRPSASSNMTKKDVWRSHLYEAAT